MGLEFSWETVWASFLRILTHGLLSSEGRPFVPPYIYRMFHSTLPLQGVYSMVHRCFA